MTGQDFVDNLRVLLNDETYSQSVIITAANWMVNQVFTDYHLRMAEETDQITVGINATTADLPDDLLTQIELWVVSPDKYRLPEALEYATFMENYSNFASATAAKVYTWTNFGKAMRFAAPAKTATTLQIDYLRTPIDMVDLTDECEIPDVYAEMAYKLTLARIMEIDEDYEEAQQERTNAAPLVTTFIRNEGRGGGKTRPTVIRTNRSGRGRAWNASRDF